MSSHPIKHLIVVMMENRSFDHMLGFLKSPTYPINGLDGTESNLDTTETPITVSRNAAISGDLNPDPGHSFTDTALQIFGDDPGPTPSPNMSGFVQNFFTKTNDVAASARIMKCFDPTSVPIITRLAQHYCVCDNWFSSIPGPTLCNRVYAHAATSIGRVDTGPDWHKITTTIYERLAQFNVDSTIYYNDFTVAMTFPNLMAAQDKYFASFQDFVSDCKHNKLPPYSFLEPRYYSTDSPGFLPAEDQHPDHNVWAGESFLRKVYEAVTMNPQTWQDSLLVITYDEHGGTFDHVHPPATVNPDGLNCTDPPFDFTRLGVRVPAILISPFVQKGAIDHTLYDHSSVVATARKLFLANWQTHFLTKRDQQANTFDDCVTLTAPRIDTLDFSSPAVTATPMHALFHANASLPVNARDEAELPLSEFQHSQVLQAAAIDRALPVKYRTGINPKTIKTERDAARYMQRVTDALRAHGKPVKVGTIHTPRKPAKKKARSTGR
jgi:phospholipase C